MVVILGGKKPNVVDVISIKAEAAEGVPTDNLLTTLAVPFTSNLNPASVCVPVERSRFPQPNKVPITETDALYKVKFVAAIAKLFDQTVPQFKFLLNQPSRNLVASNPIS